jgi:hypothetical protein
LPRAGERRLCAADEKTKGKTKEKKTSLVGMGKEKGERRKERGERRKEKRGKRKGKKALSAAGIYGN